MQPIATKLPGLSTIADPKALLIGLFEHSPVGFQVFKADGHCLFVNQAFRDAFLSEPPPEYNVLKDEILEKNGTLALVKRAFAGETVSIPPMWYDPRELQQVEVREGRRLGVQVTLFPLRSAEGVVEHVALCAKDVTAELELRERDEQLRQAQKLEAVGRLAGGIAHDFNNVLSVVLTYSAFLMRDAPPGSRLHDGLGEIRNAGERAADLTRQLLAFSRRQLLAPRMLDLNEVLSGIGKMLTRTLGENMELRTVLEPELGRVRADRSQIEQVVMNLVLNARDAMPGGGTVTVETANVTLDDRHAREPVGATPGPYVMLSVKDTGSGMDRETQARAFEPFFTTKETGKGTGLGLSTVFGIVKQSGGHICLQSQPGAGSTFTVYLPRVDGAPAAEPTRPSSPPAAGGQETVLLVEDDDHVRAAARQILEAAGYHVLEVADPREAVDLVAGHATEIHLMLSDVVMPGMNGPRLAQSLTRMRPGLRVLFMSGYTGDTIIDLGLLSEKAEFLQKPLTPEGLTKAVRRALDSPPGG